MIKDGVKSGIILTDQQLDGKGQRGKKWISQKTKSITFTVFINREIDSSKIGYLPLLCGLSVKNALADFNVSASLKWPNDIILNRKKVGGILCESRITQKNQKILSWALV